jgi:pimeloyl-ACP methyl ester carboxylesterase
VIAALLFSLATLATLRVPDDAAMRVDLGGGRRLYLTCAGVVRANQPTIILVSGYHDSTDPWMRQDLLSLIPPAVGPAVLPGLARTNRVCAYDRPGTARYTKGFPLTDRSTAVRQPRTVRDIAAELHTLLAVAKVPRPYVLVGHSLGGLISLMYARTYPDDVRGIVLVDALSPSARTRFGPRWPLYRMALTPPPQRQSIASMRLPASETVDIEASMDEVERARPLRRMALAVLTRTEPVQVPPGLLPRGLTVRQIDEAYNSAQDDLVRLAPATPHIFATGSEHYIQLSQPDLVIVTTQLLMRRVHRP